MLHFPIPTVIYTFSLASFYAGTTEYGQRHCSYIVGILLGVQSIAILNFLLNSKMREQLRKKSGAELLFGFSRWNQPSITDYDSYLEDRIDFELSKAENAIKLLDSVLAAGSTSVDIKMCVQYCSDVLKSSADELHIPLRLLHQSPQSPRFDPAGANGEDMELEGPVQEWLISHFSRAGSVCPQELVDPLDRRARRDSRFGGSDAAGSSAGGSVAAVDGLAAGIGPVLTRRAPHCQVDAAGPGSPIARGIAAGGSRRPSQEAAREALPPPPPPPMPRSYGQGRLFEFDCSAGAGRAPAPAGDGQPAPAEASVSADDPAAAA